MSTVYYSQIDPRWKDKSYSSKPPDVETIGHDGCGPTVGAMMIATLSDPKITPVEIAKFSVDGGYQFDGQGTGTAIFSALAKKYGLNYKAAKDINTAVQMLRDGYLVAANVKASGLGGLFTSAGHFILMIGLRPDGRVIVYDPYVYKGKFDKPGRAGKVEIKGNEIYVSQQILSGNVRDGYFYLGLKKQSSPDEITVNKAITAGIISSRDYWLKVLRGEETAKPEYIKTVFDKAAAKIK